MLRMNLALQWAILLTLLVGLVPPLPRYCKALRLPAAPPALLRCLRCAVPPRVLGFVPAAARRYGCGPGVVHRHPQTGFIDGDDRTSQVPGGPHCERALLFDPGGTPALGHCHASVLSSATFDDVDSHDFQHFEAQSHGPPTRCLRFAGWVAPPPRKTRFRIAGQPCPGGTGHSLSPNERFQIIPFPFPRLGLAHQMFVAKCGREIRLCAGSRLSSLI